LRLQFAISRLNFRFRTISVLDSINADKPILARKRPSA